MTSRTPIPDTVTLHVPFRIVKRGGRKEMQMPEGSVQARRTDSTLVKALARAFRWQKMLEEGAFPTISQLAAHERIASPYLSRTLRLAQLGPDIVEAILDGCQPAELTLESLRKPLPSEWARQRSHLAALCRPKKT